MYSEFMMHMLAHLICLHCRFYMFTQYILMLMKESRFACCRFIASNFAAAAKCCYYCSAVPPSSWKVALNLMDEKLEIHNVSQFYNLLWNLWKKNGQTRKRSCQIWSWHELRYILWNSLYKDNHAFIQSVIAGILSFSKLLIICLREFFRLRNK